MYYFNYKTVMGDLLICYDDIGITSICLPYDKSENTIGLLYQEDKKIKRYFDDYFSGIEPEKVSLNIKLTNFQQKVFDILLDTRMGTFLTYGDIAKLIDCGSSQAVGQALKRNPVPIIIPCHRVVGKGWDGGFGGEIEGPKIDFKKYLLKLERNKVEK
jgi:methylated-DNA-[protein]-cysteine S-methyltransferase